MDNKNNEAVDGVVASEEISLEEQQAVLEKFDQESNTRNVTGFAKGFIKWYAIAMAVFHVYTSFFGLWATIRQRAMHLLFVMPLCYLMYPAKKGGARNNPSLLDWVFAALSFVCCGYIVVNYDAIFLRGGLPNQMDIIMGCLCALLVLEAVRRVVGTQLLIIAVIFLGYAYFGRYMPGILRHRGASIARMVDHMYMAPEGIFSTALGTSATFIVLFVIFAAFLQKSGMADLIRDLAMALAGGSVGGPAKVSVVTSAAFGTISGSAAANVVTTGAFTIPLMKSTGYEPEFAGAVEAVSSTGGQLMPPIMGSAAFIMADYLGIPYVTIIKAAIIPVLLYYLSIFVSVHYRAKKLGLKGVSRENLPNAWEVFKERGHLLVPFVVVVFLLMNRYTPIFAGCAGIISCILSAALKKETRMGIRDIIDSLENGAKGCVSVAISCASVGLVIGVCTMTGLSTILGNYILEFSQGNLLLTLFLVMFLAIIMGMGLPTVAVYILLVSVAVPVVASLDVPMLAAHFYVFYFGLMANVTPPVAIPAYAAAGLAGASPSKTGWVAFRLALGAFLIPYLFMYNNSILMIDSSIPEIIYSAISPIIGVYSLNLGLEGFKDFPIPLWQRVLLVAGALALIVPGIVTDLIGLLIVAFVIFNQKRLGKKVIDHKDRKQRAEQAPQVAIGKKAGEKYCQHKDDRCGILGVAHLPQIQADEQRTQVQKQHGDGILLPFGIGFIPLDRWHWATPPFLSLG